MMGPDDIQSELVRLAHSLRPVGRPLVSVVDVAHELGTVVSLRFHTSPSSHFAQIDLGDRPPKISVYRSGEINGEREIRRWEENLLSPRERFSIAHELGHWVAFSHFQIGPQSDRRLYWEHEKAMNAFAGCLLAPDWLVLRWLDQVPEGTPVPPFAVKYWANSQCRTSEEVITKALARHRRSIGFLRLLPIKRRRDGADVLQVLCSVSGEALVLPNERSHIDSPELLGLLRDRRVGTASLPRLQLGRCTPYDGVQLAWRRGSSFKSQETIWLSAAIHSDDIPTSQT